MLSRMKGLELTRELLAELSLSDAGNIWGYLPSPEEVLQWFAFLEAGWVYQNDPAHAHAILHSGKHSNGFFLCKKVLAWGNLREILAACMIAELRKAGLGKVDGVFGSPQSSILLSGDIGRLIGVKTYVLEKDASDPTGKKMSFKGDDPAPAGSVLLQIEELVTTWSSGGASSDAVIAGNPYPITLAPFVGVLVHRPPKINRTLPDGRVLVPFIEKQVDAWDPGKCPPCAAGSKAILPKTNWAELIA